MVSIELRVRLRASEWKFRDEARAHITVSFDGRFLAIFVNGRFVDQTDALGEPLFVDAKIGTRAEDGGW